MPRAEVACDGPPLPLAYRDHRYARHERDVFSDVAIAGDHFQIFDAVRRKHLFSMGQTTGRVPILGFMSAAEQDVRNKWIAVLADFFKHQKHRWATSPRPSCKCWELDSLQEHSAHRFAVWTLHRTARTLHTQHFLACGSRLFCDTTCVFFYKNYRSSFSR